MSPTITRRVLGRPRSFADLAIKRQVRTTILFSSVHNFDQVSCRVRTATIIDLLGACLSTVIATVLARQNAVSGFVNSTIVTRFNIPASRKTTRSTLDTIRTTLTVHRTLTSLHRQFRGRKLPPLCRNVNVDCNSLIINGIKSVRQLRCATVNSAIGITDHVRDLAGQIKTSLLVARPLCSLIGSSVVTVSRKQRVLTKQRRRTIRICKIIKLQNSSSNLCHQIRQRLTRCLSRIPPDPRG